MASDKLSVIIPTYNERDNIPIIIPRLSNVLREHDIPFEILVMDDNSPDGTYKAVEDVSREYPETRCIVRKENRGLSPSVMDGYARAEGDVLLVMDADLSHPVEVVPELFHAISRDGADVAVGSRHTKGGGVENWPASRRIISWGASLLARPLTGCSDPMSGFFAVRPSVIEGAPLRAKGYKILLEVLVKGNWSSLKEVPITFRDREMGESKLGSKVIVNYLQHLFKLYLFPGSAPLIKFLFVGGTGMMVDLGILTLMLFLMGTGKTDYMISQSVSFMAAVTWNFFWNRMWTFDSRKAPMSSQYLKFFMVAVVAFAIRSGLSYLGVKVLDISEPPYYQMLTFGVILVVTIINYIGSRFWAFRK